MGGEAGLDHLGIRCFFQPHFFSLHLSISSSSLHLFISSSSLLHLSRSRSHSDSNSIPILIVSLYSYKHPLLYLPQVLSTDKRDKSAAFACLESRAASSFLILFFSLAL